MHSILDKSKKVNGQILGAIEPRQGRAAALPENRQSMTLGEKWASKKQESIWTAKRLEKWSYMRRRAALMTRCGELVFMEYCEKCGKTHLRSGVRCRDRLCPLCGWRLSLSRYGEMMGVFDVLSADMTEKDVCASMLTLTLRNCSIKQLSDTLDRMSAAWREIARRKDVKSLYGWARSLEITYNKEANSYHPHLHILMLWQGGTTGAENARFNRAVIELWKRYLGIDYEPIWHHGDAYVAGSESDVAQCSEIYDWREQRIEAAKAAALEASKYIIGDKLALDIPDTHIPLFAEAIKNRNFVGYGGAIKVARAALGYKDDDINDTAELDESRRVCASCGEKMQRALMQWAGTCYVVEAVTDGEGVCGHDK